jgi:two-component system sensor histidine kinase PilS (NtrC family)
VSEQGVSFRRNLRRLNAARAIAVSSLLVSTYVIEILFAPERSLQPFFFLSAAAYATVLLYAVLDRRFGGRAWIGAVQVVGDAALLVGFVLATGGALSPLSFLLGVPVLAGAALLGLRGGVLVSLVIWSTYAGLLVVEAWRAPPAASDAGPLLYAAVSHLLGFSLLAVLGGVLADHLQRTGRELEQHREDLDALRVLHADIVASINTGLITTDGDGRITFVNRAGEELLGSSTEEVVGSAVSRLFGFPGSFLASAGDHLQQGKKFRFERRWRDRGGDRELLLGFSVSFLKDPHAEPRGWLIVFQDLTEIASLEEQVRVQERMAALGEMAAGMAHELRNPLTSICGCVQVLETREDAEESRRLKEVVLREAQRLNGTLKDFLAFARPGPHRPQECALSELMEQMARMLRKSPEFRDDHEVIVRKLPGGDVARVDPDAMRQVFWNLASNALRAMPGGGRLEIEIGGHGVDEVMVCFRDQGCGMDEEAIKRYFQPFGSGFQGGTGLGAAIVYRIVDEHGGRVQAVSPPGEGTEIRLILPGAPAAGRPAMAAVAATAE